MAKWLRRLHLDQKVRATSCAAVIAVAQTVTYELLEIHFPCLLNLILFFIQLCALLSFQDLIWFLWSRECLSRSLATLKWLYLINEFKT